MPTAGHLAYFKSCLERGLSRPMKETKESYLRESLFLCGAFWTVCGAIVVGEADDKMQRNVRHKLIDTSGRDCPCLLRGEREILELAVWKLQDAKSGGFRCGDGQPPTLLGTLCALQVLISIASAPVRNLVDKLWDFVWERFEAFMQGDVPGGAFVEPHCGSFGPDIRDMLCAVAILFATGSLPAVAAAKRDRIVQFLAACQNADGGFGRRPGEESHAGFTFCAVAATELLQEWKRFPPRSRAKLQRWLCDRQPSAALLEDPRTAGSFCGRAGKEPDVCYSWWIAASSAMLGLLELTGAFNIRSGKEAILRCQGASGGFGKRPGTMPDIFHSYFAVASILLVQTDTMEIETSKRVRLCIPLAMPFP